MTSSDMPLVEMTGICKEFPGVKALDGVDFTLMPGEVHVLFGENGAGKSTLISILAGVYQPTSGHFRINGRDARFPSVKEARAAGVCAVFQEFSLVPTMSVAQNLFLGSELLSGPFVDHGRARREAEKLFGELGFSIDVGAPVAALSRAQQQMVEIAKAFHAKARILILDEPTASLTERETAMLFRFIGEARAAGVGIVYISHRMHEFAAIANRITVLRDGKLVRTVDAAATSESELIELMTGRSIDRIYPDIDLASAPETVMKVRGLEGPGVHGVSFDIRKGEVLGIAGLVGSGKSRAFRTLFGLSGTVAGTVVLDGHDVTGATPETLIARGVFYLPSDRKREGLFLGADARENIALSMLNRPDTRDALGFRSPARLRRLTDDIGRRIDISQAFLNRTVAKLSGGNQQKVLFGKALSVEREIYILDEPTVGVDMGTRAAIYRLIKQMAETGKAVVVISSDLAEVMNLSHRLLVFANGTIAAELAGEAINEQTVLGHFFQGGRLGA